MRTNNVNRKLVRVILFVGVILTMMSCKKDQSVDPTAQLITPFTGITHTDSTSAIVGSVDSADWKPISVVGMQFPGEVGAYPNPCHDIFSLEWIIRSKDSVLITLNDSPQHSMVTIFTQRLDSGAYAIRKSLAGYQPAIYRLYFKIVRPDSTYVTYGDIQVK
jgi:hypothetical protein